ncbi:MAG TPA: alpha/beta fold hydrolase [Mycobacteriales bacterium]|nr:alpha/beta fold hydrolase [Mycobacteriales bacterium]
MATVVHRASRAAARGLRTVASPDGIRGAGTELAWIAAHVALYPMGFRAARPAGTGDRHRLDGLTPVQRGLLHSDVEAAGTPILLVHGMVGNGSIFTVLRRSLSRRGFGPVHTVNYSPFTRDVRTAARLLSRQVEILCGRTGYERVHLIAHSLGGVIARYYVQLLGGDARVHTLVTLGTPHGGTNAAHLLPVLLARQLRPGSDLLAELDAPVPRCDTRFVAIWSDLDQLIYPKEHAQLAHPGLAARNVLLAGAGHLSLPSDRRAIQEVSRALTRLQVDGTSDTDAADVATVSDCDNHRPQPPGRRWRHPERLDRSAG